MLRLSETMSNGIHGPSYVEAAKEDLVSKNQSTEYATSQARWKAARKGIRLKII